MGTLPGGAARPDDGRQPAGPPAAQRPLAGAARLVSGLRRTHYPADEVASTPSRLAEPGRVGGRGEPGVAAPQLSPASACERVLGVETASRRGRWIGLSRVRGNSLARFLGGGEGVTLPCYPAQHGVILEK